MYNSTDMQTVSLCSFSFIIRFGDGLSRDRLSTGLREDLQDALRSSETTQGQGQQQQEQDKLSPIAPGTFVRKLSRLPGDPKDEAPSDVELFEWAELSVEVEAHVEMIESSPRSLGNIKSQESHTEHGKAREYVRSMSAFFKAFKKKPP